MKQTYTHGGEVYGKNIWLDFSANINPLLLPEGVKRAVSEHLDTYCRYPDDQCEKLRKAIASAKGVSSDWVLCGNGAADIIYRYALAVKASRVLIPAPTFSEYEKAFVLAGAKICYATLQEETGFSFEEEVKLDNIDVVVLCNPNNPVGNLAERALIEKILTAATIKGKRLLVDECFMELSGCEEKYSVMPCIERHPGLLIVKAFTKTYAMAGLRLGYGISSDTELLAKMKMAGAPWSVSGVAQVAGIAALREVEYLDRAVRLIKTEREYLERELSKLGYQVYPSMANYLMFRAEEELYQRLLERGVLIRQCGNYRGLGDQYYRICVGLHKENEQLIRVMRE